MNTPNFSSGPIRSLTQSELGFSGFTDFTLLSDGGHNLLYKALLNGKWVVLKVAKEEEGNSARNRFLLQREYDIMHAIDCLYVVKTWQMTDVPELGPAIVMEYVAGRSLGKFLAETPSSAERRRVAEELMEALIFLHDRQVVHGDLKSSNILITDSGNHVRLIDFGFSDTEAYVAKNIGSSPSISMEKQLPSDVLLPERDIYALGKILEMLFPHSAKPVTHRCLSSGRKRYTSVRQARTALHRYWRMRWLLPMLLFVTIAVILFLCLGLPLLPPQTTGTLAIAPQDTFVHKDTIVHKDTVVVVKTTQPQVDVQWQNLSMSAERAYRELYQTYSDSIRHLQFFNDARTAHHAYASLMYQKSENFVKAHPQYETQLRNQYLAIYDRDYKRLVDIYKDYPIMRVNFNGDTIILPLKPLSE